MRRAEAVVRGDRQGQARVDTRELLDADAVVDRRHPRTAVLLGKLDAHQAERSQGGDDLRWKVLRLVPLAHVRPDFGLRELANRAPQQSLFLGLAKVHVAIEPITAVGADALRAATRHFAVSSAGMMRRLFQMMLATGVLLAAAVPARADATLFIGATMTPDTHQARGAALGAGLLIVAFEGEYSNSPESPEAGAPGLRLFSGNGLIQTPVAIFGFQPYFTIGAGVYRETVSTRTDTGFATNLGGGVKISLAGPVRLRVDYRVFKLGSDALYSPSHRFYAGLNLRF